MDKRTTIITILVAMIVLIALMYLAYVIDSNKIATFADTESTKSAQDLTSLPSPDESIISKIYTAIISPFVGNK